MTRPFSRSTLEWTAQATRQLDQAHDYIALANSEEVADRITTRIVSTIQQLDAFPMSGRSGRVPGTRELVISNTPFIAAYAIDPYRVTILAIYHGAQQWPESF
jgi:addiction module RelE/StbE family toxin